MNALRRKGAILAATTTIALGLGAAPLAAAGADQGHHHDWSDRQCKNQRARWMKAHKHPTAKQTKQENNLLQKHGCTERV